MHFYLFRNYCMTTDLRHAGGGKKTENLVEEDVILSSRRHSPVKGPSGWCSVALGFTLNGTFYYRFSAPHDYST